MGNVRESIDPSSVLSAEGKRRPSAPPSASIIEIRRRMRAIDWMVTITAGESPVTDRDLSGHSASSLRATAAPAARGAIPVLSAPRQDALWRVVPMFRGACDSNQNL